jgi:tetratricopeptide (TPR) repeat protein
MVSAAALVIIAVAVIAFLMRRPAGRADSGERGAPAAPASPAAPAPVATGPAAAPGLAAPTREAPVSVTDDLSQLTESARALYRAGKYDEAARAAGRALQKAPGNAEARRLMSDVARYARQAATEAVSSLAAARARAESAGAASAAPAAFGRALERERQARARLAARDYADATTTAYSAQGLFEAAAAEALGRAQARTVPEAAPTGAAPAAPVDEPHAAAPFPAVLPVPGPTPAAAPPPPAAPSPPPAPAATERRASDPLEAIRRTMQQYTAALEARSLSGLKQVWPGLGGAQERAIRAEFDNARQISVALESPRIQVSGDTATVVATRRYALATVDGHELRSDTRSTFQLRAVDGSWVIESVRFDAAR